MRQRFTICDLRFACCPSNRSSRREEAPSALAPWLSAIRHRLFLAALAGRLTISQLHAQPSQKPADDIPPLAPPLREIPPTPWEQFGWTLWIVIPLLLVAAGFIVWLLLRPGKPPVLLAPAAQARAVLGALQNQPEDGAALSRISQALRNYLITAFWLRPEEATTTEFYARLQASERVGPELATAAGEFLRACDARKFSPEPAAAPLNAAQRALALVAQAEARRVALSAVAPTVQPK